jgi:phage repressor protein C with HTH and peptisase S24 domain
MNDTPHGRLKLARIRAHYRTAKLAAAAHGWNYDSYKTHEAGTREISPARAKVYADAFHVSAAYILTGEGGGGALDPILARIPIRVVPLMDLLDIDQLRAVAGGARPIGISDVAVDSGDDITPRAFAAVVITTAMVSRVEPSIDPGDIVIISPETQIEPGKIVLAVVNGETMLRKYRPANHGGDATSFILVPLNDDFPTIHTSIEDGSFIVGRAIRRITKM